MPEIDVFLTCLPKDLPCLPYCVDGLRRNLRDPIRKIFCVAPDLPDMRAAAEALGCHFRDENTIAPTTTKDIDLHINGVNRSGWALKQLLTLSADQCCDTEYMLVHDCDTVLIRPWSYFYQGKTIMLMSNEFYHPYHTAYHNVMGIGWRFPMSSIAHGMIYRRQYLKELRQLIEWHTGLPWHEAIVREGRRPGASISFFADFETYGVYCLLHHKQEFLLQYWNNRAFEPDRLPEFETLAEQHKAHYRTLSFHVYEKALA